MSSLTDRMIRATKLDPAIYEEVEHDSTAMGQAAAVVVLSSIAAGVGSVAQAGLATGLVLGTIAALLAWLIWAFLTWIIGTKLLPEEATEADMGQLLRTLGFASAPGLLRVLGLIPGIGPLLVLACNIWMLAAMVVAVRQALDFESTGRAVAVCLIGFLVLIVVQGLLFAAFGPAQPANAA
jgi:hypothetical protein